ncbi:MAG: branched-chain amino acid ABC transporter permease [Chloroflexota bacterium]|nr:MAG: branched-chain amino acid ABC transporter permease [Chloroflexota bacterium]
MNWPLVPQQIATGILNGGIIALIALGIVLIFKSSEVFNFAQGQLVMLGAFVTWWFAGAAEDGGEIFNMPLWAAVIAALIIMALLGLLIERLALRPMTGQPLLSIVLMTLGLAAFLDGVAAVVFGIEPKSNFPAPYSPSDVIIINFPGAFNDTIILKNTLVAAFVVAMLATFLLMLFFRLTRTGLSMRATAEDHELARSVGIKVPRIFGLSWALAGMIATLGGVLLASQVGVSLNLATVVLVAFPAVLLGGLDSFPGAIIGGIVVGLVVALTQTASAVEVRNAAEIAPYILLLIVLIIRPEGLFGQKRIERI